MANRTLALFFCVAFVAICGFLSGCGHKYEDQETGITIRELGSDLDNRWAFKGVVVESVKPGKPADGVINAGELISYIVDERRVTNIREYRKAFGEALEDDEEAMLRLLKTVSVTSIQDLGIRTKPDPEERGVIVDWVGPGSKAEEAGIKQETVIYELNGASVKSVDSYNLALEGALANSGEITFSLARRILASRLGKAGIADVEDHKDGVVVAKMAEAGSEDNPADMEGVAKGDVITHVIDEMKVTGIKSYKKAIRKAADADRVIFKRGELGGIKLAAIDALGQIGDTKAVSHLLKALESEDRWIRRAAAKALEKMDDDRIMEPLMVHLLEANEEDIDVRRSAAKALARMRSVESIEPLALALKDSSLGVRLEAGYALGRIGTPAIDVLIKAKNDDDSRVRDSAVAALGNIGGQEVRNELTGVLRDEDEESTVKLTAIQALYKIGDSESIAELKRVSQTGDPGLRAFVKELLAEETL